MDIDSLNNKIIIIDDSMKSSLLNIISNKLVNTKIITFSEVLKKYFFDYDKKTIMYICNKYNVIYDVANVYLNNIHYINDKTPFLSDLKSDLDSNGLLYKNNLFKSFLMNKEVVLLDKYIDKFYLNILNNLRCKISYIDLYNNDSVKKLYACNNKEEEVVLLASNICNLIKSGVNINRIKIANLSSDYSYTIRRIFKMFKLPINIPNDGSINGTKIVSVFKSNYSSDIKGTLDKTLEYVKTSEDNKLYKKIIGVVNNYSFIDDYMEVKDYIFEDLSKIKLESKKYKNAVNVIDFYNDIISDDDYVFLINYNEGVIPVNYKDEDYFNDKDKLLLGIDTSYEKNKKNIDKIRDKIKGINHLVVSYSKKDLKGELYISSSYSSELFEETNYSSDFTNSNNYNKIKLVSLKDEYKKFGTCSDDLSVLNNMYKDEKYLSFDNKYKLIDKNLLNKDLRLSYTSLNMYNECAYKYYLNNVIKLNDYEDTFYTIVGSVFHKILSICFEKDIDIDKVWDSEISSYDYEFNNTEKFFLSKLNGDLVIIIESIKNQLNYTSFDKFMYEKEIIIDVNKDLHITFKGIIDKIMYGEDGIVVLIDYKTGNSSFDINNTIYGLSMQLPIYMYLIKNSNIISNVKVGGLYLQKIMPNEENDYRLEGITTSNEDVLSFIDSSYENSKIIKGLRVGNNGFYVSSKVLSEDKMDELYNLVSDKVNETALNIMDAKFDINPKVIKGKNVACEYCKFKDICFVKNDDVVELPYKKVFFGGEEDA